MDDSGAEGRAAGLKPSVMHLVAGGLGLVRARLELAGIELAEGEIRLVKWSMAKGREVLESIAISFELRVASGE